VFSNKPKCYKSYAYHSKLKEVTIRTKQYPIAQSVREATNLELTKLESWNIIEQAESSHNNPLHVVKKDMDL